MSDSARQWHVAVAGNVFGPADRALLEQWAANGRIPADAQVMEVGADAWVPLSSVGDLSGLPIPTPLPGPPVSAAPPPTVDEIAPCPHCGGPIANITPSYGMLFGVMEKRILPKLRCARCQATVPIDELPEPARAEIIRSKRSGIVIWICIVSVALGGLALVGWGWISGTF